MEDQTIKNKNNIIRKSLKYILEFLIIFMAVKYVPTKELPINEIIIIAIIGTCGFALLDLFIPNI
ncbi:MAG: hypothetical protein Edafosvirus8_2 [Edafosvirus sp.]|uniref:Uncharacterized protein n=1 Tax=Edafosvirus sp. TaxID=2487765 RepID=A0A3G4ZTM6_9VIRU|nr:MAG: hypothetical protein Edafosvirus8_2 [Edafosvirus sp.]